MRPRFVEYEDAIAIEYRGEDQRAGAKEQVPVALPGFWRPRLNVTACLDLFGVTAVRVPKGTPRQELQELVRLRWTVIPEWPEPPDAYASWPIDRGRRLVARYPGGLKLMPFAWEALPPNVLPSSWALAASLARSLEEDGCPSEPVHFSLWDFGEWIRQRADSIAVQDVARVFAGQLRGQRETAALLAAAGIPLVLQRASVDRIREFFHRTKQNPFDELAWVAASSDFPTIERPYVTWLIPRNPGTVARTVVSAHSAQPWLGERAPIDYLLSMSFDADGRLLASMALWYPYLAPDDESNGLEALTQALRDHGLVPPDGVGVVDGVWPVLVSEDGFRLVQPAAGAGPGGLGGSFRHGPRGRS